MKHLLGLLLFGSVAAWAGEPIIKQKIVPLPPVRVSDEERDRIIQTLTEAEPALKKLLARFPDARVAVSAAPPQKERYAVSASKTIEGYHVHMRVTAAFDETFAQAANIERTMFTAVRVADVKTLRPGQVLSPIWMSFDRIDEFCEDPRKVITTSPVRTGPKTFVPPAAKTEAPPKN